jgi:hypothetical protein
MASTTEHTPEDRVDDLRHQLRALGYLDAGVDRFVLGPAKSARRPWVIAALAASRIGVIAAALLGPAAALGIGVRLPGLITGPRDAFVVALFFAALFGLAAAIVSFTASMLVGVLPVSGLAPRARLVSRAAGTLVGAASLVYLTFWWRIATPETGPFSSTWTLFALAVAAGISVLLGHVTAITAFAVLVARNSAAALSGPRQSAARLTVTAGVLAFAGASALLLLTTPDRDPEPERPALAVVSPGARVTVFAIDGFDPAVLEKLRADGRTPAFARLAAHGALTLPADDVRDPARVWTTVATGQPPDVHGVHGLETRRVAGLQGALTTTPSGLGRTLRAATDLLRLTRPAIASGTELRSKTFWEVAADAGLRTAVVNWWATWPADSSGPNPPIVISDRATLRLERGGDPEGEIAPRPVYDRLAREWPAIKLEANASIDAHLPAGMDAATVTVLRRAAEVDAVQVAMAKRLRTESLDLLAVYLPGLDIVQHTLIGSNSAASPSALSARLEGVRSYYIYLDALVGEVSVPGPGELVMLVTHPGRIEGAAPGLLMAVGRGTGDVSSKETGRPIDLAPTLLYALGLPASRELAGAPLLSLFDPEFVQRYPVRHVESYGKRRAPALQGQPMDQEMIERLRSLGYVR